MATGSALALVTSAEASGIVYSGTENLTVSIPETPGTHKAYLPIYLTGGTKANFKLSIFNNLPATSSLRKESIYLRGFLGLGSVGKTHHDATRLPPNFPVTYLKPFAPGRFEMAKTFITSTRFNPHKVSGQGPWFTCLCSPGFAPIRLPNGDLGWIRIQFADTNHDGFVDQATVIDWAYNSTPGATILTGDTGVPEPGSGSMAVLASGAAGILALRRRKQAARKSEV